jgi:hypothetical protein
VEVTCLFEGCVGGYRKMDYTKYNGYNGLFRRGEKRPRREADHSPPSSDEVKDSGAILPITLKFSWLIAELIQHRKYFFSSN